MEYQIVIIAAGGGLAIQLLTLLELPQLEKKNRPDFSDFTYYIPFLVNPIISAFVAYVYVQAQTQLNPILALHIGASAPLILRTMASTIPNKNYD